MSGRGTKDTYFVSRPEQLEAVVSTRRHEIIDLVAGAGPMSVKEIAAALGVAPSSLYYHIEHLCAVGLLREAGVRQDGQKPEQLYTTPAPRMSMFRALQAPRNRGVLQDIVASVSRQAARDFSAGFDAPHCDTSGPRRNLRFLRMVGRPDAATLQKINAHLDAVTELMAKSAQGSGNRIALTWVAAPQADTDDA
jgi:AcrR family transcriptional regulator